MDIRIPSLLRIKPNALYKLGKYLRFDARDLRAYVDAKRSESHRNPRRR